MCIRDRYQRRVHGDIKDIGNMRLLIVLLVCLSFFFSVITAEPIKDEIMFVGAIIRHGARRMLFQNYLNITDDVSSYKNLGMLTKVGKHQLYLLGRQFAKKYMSSNVILNPKYNPRQIKVRTAGLNRTIESAQSFLSGLYSPGLGESLPYFAIDKIAPPIKVENINKIRQELRDAALPFYQSPIPIHTANGVHDMLFSPHTECPAVKEDEKRYAKNFTKSSEKYTNDYKKFSEVFGFTPKWTLDECYMLYDNVMSVLGNGLELNKKVPAEVMERLKNISFENNRDFYLRSELKQKLLGYTILSDLKDHFSKAINESKYRIPFEQRRRMALFFASDTHILALFKLFQFPISDSIPFASALVFELHRQEDIYGNELYTIKAYYNNNPIDLSSRDITKYSAFRDYIKAHTYENDTDYFFHCNPYDRNTYDRELWFSMAIILFLTFLTIWVFNWVLLIRKPKEKKEEPILMQEPMIINEEKKIQY
eukprot:TRINITY_DN931_c0_g1_i1.p1 TRINITY_DN931_c0_g1~~TRINITY_DN931_c0_g1_i1.p1  ORF type:complete len:481 (+),score=84.38 TRINITY_DN931_c0_g1_i1:111-1553(+)